MILEEQRKIRANYTDKVRRRSPMFRGGGGVGTVIRGVQTNLRAGERQVLAKQLEPLEVMRRHLEGNITNIDGETLRLQSIS